MTFLIQLIIVLVIIGGILYLVQLAPLNQFVKTAIYVVVAVGVLVWLLKNLGSLGLAI